MGEHKNISYDRFPVQGPPSGLSHVGSDVEVCFHFDTSHILKGKCIRDDWEDPHVTIFQLEDGRCVLATECQYHWVGERSI